MKVGHLWKKDGISSLKFLFFFCIVSLAITSSAILNRSVKRRHSCFVWILEESIPFFNINISWKSSQMPFSTEYDKVTVLSQFSQNFFLTKCFNLSSSLHLLNYRLFLFFILLIWTIGIHARSASWLNIKNHTM